jgi:hypothetical protein
VEKWLSVETFQDGLMKERLQDRESVILQVRESEEVEKWLSVGNFIMSRESASPKKWKNG